jgi:integrase
MARDLLAVKTIEAAISAAVKSGERSELNDGGGLVLRCPPSGVAKWTYAYRSRSAGGMRRVTLGTFGKKPPFLTLEAARAARDEAKRRNDDDGIDPHAHRDRERAAQAQADITFGALCELYVEHVKARGKLSWQTDYGYLIGGPLPGKKQRKSKSKKEVVRPKAKFGKRAVSSITKRELMDYLEEVAHTSKSSANRTQSTLRTMWGWAAERDYIPMNFLAGIKKVGGKEAEKDRVLTLDELKTFFAALDDASTSDTVRRALKLILLTAQRPGEVAGMMLSELHDLDGPAPHWIIPRARTKNKKDEHTVPLSPAAVRLIGEARDASQDETPGANDQPVFGSKFEAVTTLARHSLSQAVRRIVSDKDNDLAAFTPHDLRRTGATIAQAARLPVDFVKALLNHNDKGVTGIYARWHMFEEKREAVMAIEAAVLPLMPQSTVLAA